jgi:asparagine synthase (glutamine-hydrolysing)
MCGIAATIGDVGRISSLVRAVAHRGPDQSGTASFERFAIGAARLQVDGDQRAAQPLRGASGLSVVANAEVFNHSEFRGDVSGDAGEGDLPPFVRRLESDFPGAFSKIRGPFAMAAIHERLRLLALARDEAGIRPLHVLANEDGLLASSEIWPLVASLPSPPELDQDAVAHLLAFQFLPAGKTLFRGIEPVLPGEARLYDPMGRCVRRDRVRFDAGPGTDLAAALREAAALQGRRAPKAAVFLSGGLDSSAVAGLLAEVGRPPDVAFTGWFPEGDVAHDERPHASAVAAELGIPLVLVPVRAADALDVFPALVRALGGPLAGPGGLAQFLIARTAAAHGVRVVYSGEGGDELFGGYERHRILQQIESRAAVDPLPGYAPLARRMEAAQDPLAAAIFRGAEIMPLLHPDMRLRVGDAAFLALPSPGPDRADRAVAFERTTFLPGLLSVNDVTLSAFGVEGRVPLLDPVVATLASSVPLGLKSPPEAPRRLFRAAVGAALPHAAARRRDKMGFPMPLETWLGTPPWRDYALDRIGSASLERFGFDGPRVRMAIEARRLSARTTWFVLALDVFDQLLGGTA